MDDRDWVLIDVETAGLDSPVVVERAARRRRGSAILRLGAFAMASAIN